MRFTLLLYATLLSLSFDINAQQNQEQEVLNPIYTLFDGMREGDGKKVRAAFSKNAIFYRAHAELRAGSSVEEFAQAVASERDAIWDEKIWDIQIHIDDKLASVWTKFAFYLGDKFSHCGVNSFQLYQFDDGWKIIYLVDTNRKIDCETPP